MTHPNRLARRALCLHSGVAAMTLATHHTQAPAARKRGGGHAQDLQMNASTLGRHPLPEGGEINSLCRAAAGIIPSLPAGSGAHVYPKKGVRGGAEDGRRSATPQSPAAQPVKGYKHPVQLLPLRSQPVRQNSNGQAGHSPVVIELGNVFCFTIDQVPSIPAHQPLANRPSERRTNLQLTQNMYLTRLKLLNGKRLEGLNVRWPLLMPLLFEIRVDGVYPKVAHSFVDSAMKEPKLLLLIPGEKEEHRSQLLLRSFLLLLFMNVRKRSSSSQREHRTERLSPASLFLDSEVFQDNKKSPSKRTDCEKAPHDPDTHDLHVARRLHDKAPHKKAVVADCRDSSRRSMGRAYE